MHWRMTTYSFYGPFTGQPEWCGSGTVSCSVFWCGCHKDNSHTPTPCCSYPQVSWLACQQTILQERHTESEQTNSDPRDFTPTAFPVTTLQIKPGIKIYWLYTLVAWHQQIQQYYSKSKQTVHWKISKDLVKKTCRSQTTVACKTITVYRTNALQVKPTFLSA